MDPQGGKTKGLVVATRCATLDEFVASFQRYCDESSFFVATLTTRPAGLETPFAILLADRTPVLRGLCTVLEAWTTPNNKYKVPGIRLGIRRLTPDAAEVFARLRPKPAVPPPIPPRRPTIPSSPFVTGGAPMQVVMHPLPAGLRLPATDMDSIPTPFSPNASLASPPASPPAVIPRATPNPLVADPDLPTPDSDGRMPGSELVLPANPLMNLTDHSLEGFVDCTLYEETPGFTRAAQPEPTAIPEAPATARARATIPPIFEVDAISEPVPGTPTTQITPLVAVTPSTQIAPLATAAPFDASEPHPISRVSRLRLPRWLLVAAPASLVVIVVIAIVAASARDARSTTVSTPELAVAAPKQPSPPLPSPSRPPPSPPAPSPPAPSPPPPPARIAATTPEPPETPEEAEPTQTTAAGVPVVGTGPCQLTVSSTPAGSTVVVDGKVVGPSPIQLAGPCARRKVDVVHPRYKLGTKFVNLVAGTPGSVDITLSRPTHKVTITTFPSGATVSIGGRRAGTTPTILQVMGFSNLKLEITKPGYKPVTTKFYSKTPEDKLSLRLTR